ncbi:MAG: Imm50 family immunity protein [Bacteroidota bacterium]
MWINKIENPEAIKQTLGASIPDLEDIMVQSVELDYNGPVLRMNIDLQELAEVPKKWLLKGYNSAVISLQFVAVSNVKILEWSTSTKCTIRIYSLEDVKMGVSVEGDIDIKFECLSIYIDNIAPYTCETQD